MAKPSSGAKWAATWRTLVEFSGNRRCRAKGVGLPCWPARGKSGVLPNTTAFDLCSGVRLPQPSTHHFRCCGMATGSIYVYVRIGGKDGIRTYTYRQQGRSGDDRQGRRTAKTGRDSGGKSGSGQVRVRELGRRGRARFYPGRNGSPQGQRLMCTVGIEEKL